MNDKLCRLHWKTDRFGRSLVHQNYYGHQVIASCIRWDTANKWVTTIIIDGKVTFNVVDDVPASIDEINAHINYLVRNENTVKIEWKQVDSYTWYAEIELRKTILEIDVERIRVTADNCTNLNIHDTTNHVTLIRANYKMSVEQCKKVAQDFVNHHDKSNH